jgi:hypothetical protein
MRQDIRAAFRLSISALALGLSVSFARPAGASDTYPGAIREALSGMPCDPPCTVCHETLSGGIGTATKPFAESIKATADLGCCNEDLVAGALETMRNSCAGQGGNAPPGCNSDGDDMPDIEELEEGRDPNVSGVGNLCGGPVYGCGARVAGGTTEFDWVSLLAAGAAALALIHSARRMRKRS